MFLNVHATLANPVEDGGVATDDGEAGKNKTEHHEKLFRGFSVHLEDGAGECLFVEPRRAPDAQQGRQHHAEREQPDGGHHQEDVETGVDPAVPRVAAYQHVPVDRDGDHVHQRGGDIAVEEEGEDATEGVAESPLLVNISGRRERKVNGGEEQIRDGETDDKGRCGVNSQFLASQKSHHRDEVASNSHHGEYRRCHRGEYGGRPGVVDRVVGVEAVVGDHDVLDGRDVHTGVVQHGHDDSGLRLISCTVV